MKTGLPTGGKDGAGRTAPVRATEPGRSLAQTLPVAVLLPATAAVLQWQFPQYFAHAPWLVFFPGVFLVSWVGGWTSGLIATVVSVALGWWYFVPPLHAVHKGPDAYVGAGVFIGMCALFCQFHHAFRRANQRLRASRTQYARLFELAPDAAFIADKDGRFAEVNVAFCRMLGRYRDEMLGKSLAEVMPAEDAAPLHQVLALLRRDGKGQADWGFFHRNGIVVPCEISASALPDGTWEGLIRDISVRRRLESQLKHTAHHDPLTGLPNRLQFGVDLQAALARVRRNEDKLALLYLDLDGFKDVNDSLGHAAGDQLLREVAARLLRCVRAGDAVARLGGDEFTLLLEGIGEAANAGEVASKIIASVREPIGIEAHTVRVSASVGISVYPDDAQTTQTLMRNADAALYQAKNQGRDTFRFCPPELVAPASEPDPDKTPRPRTKAHDPPSALALSAGMRPSGRHEKTPG